MTAKFILCISALFLLLAGGGCEKGKDVSQCYTGKVLTLVGIGLEQYNIIEITSTPRFGGDLSIGSTITFNRGDFSPKLKIGDVVRFRIIRYEEWSGPATADHRWPQYVGEVEPCND